jgi:hypothetical protein
VAGEIRPKRPWRNNRQFLGTMSAGHHFHAFNKRRTHALFLSLRNDRKANDPPAAVGHAPAQRAGKHTVDASNEMVVQVADHVLGRQTVK